MLTTGIFLVFTATLYALFRILRQHMYRLKANSSPNWIAWHLLALLFLTIFPSWYCLRSLQPACQWLSLSPDIAAIPSIIIGWLLTRRYRILP